MNGEEMREEEAMQTQRRPGQGNHGKGTRQPKRRQVRLG